MKRENLLVVPDQLERDFLTRNDHYESDSIEFDRSIFLSLRQGKE